MAEKNDNITLIVEGMDCSNCAQGITRNLQKKGMEHVFVDFATGEASFTLPSNVRVQTAIDAVTELGYKVVDTKDAHKHGSPEIYKRFFFTLPFTIPLFLSHMLFPHDFFLNQPIVQLLLCIPVFVIGVLQFGRSAWGSLKTGVPNMDVLIFAGSTSAFIYSIAGMAMYYGTHEVHNYMFFETTATIITLVLLGNLLEHRSVRQTTSAIRDLTALQPETAKIVSLQFGKETITEIDYKAIHVGVIILVNLGDKIPVDGEIISGSAGIDESMITGESLPADRNPGDKVIGGTIVISGSVRMRAEKVGDQTMLARIIELVKKAQQEKPAIQKLGDRISAIFVPVVLSISVLTFLISYFAVHLPFRESIMHSIAVMVISCPCAMGLATPTAVMVGIGRAAKQGILIRGGSTLEQFAGVTKMVFDKTGTLTTGKFSISKIHLYNNADEKEVWDILFSLEQHSSHPIAASIVRELHSKARLITFTGAEEHKGLSVSAHDKNGNTYSAGSWRIAEKHTEEKNHSIYVLKNNSLIAAVDLRDDLKQDAAQVIAGLKKEGIESVLVSGDTEEKCQDIASRTGIEKVYSGQLPEEKLDLMTRINSASPSAMAGDGVNDAPALAKATVGISMGNATQVAIQSAQIVLLRGDDLSSLLQARLISKHTLITIRQNFFWAFAYNLVAIPLAVAGVLTPMAGALFMAFSDVVVIGNSIRLKTKKLR